MHREGVAKDSAHTEGVAKGGFHEDVVAKGNMSMDKCGLSFDHEQAYFSHLIEHTAGEEGVHEDRGMHEGSVHEEEGVQASEDKLTCPFCGLQFEHKSLLLQHITVHTGEEEEEEEEYEGVHEENVHNDDEDDDDNGEEEVFFAITVQ